MQLIAFLTPTHYQRIGQAPKKLVLLHGWGHSFETFSPIIPALADYFTLFLPDLPAFGRSADPVSLIANQAWDSQAYVTWLADFLTQTVGDDPFYLLGHSFGGKVAALYAAQVKPSNLKQLILMDSAGLPLPLTPKEQLVQSIAKLTPNSLKRLLHKNVVSRALESVGVAADYQHANDYQQAILRRVVREDISSSLPAITVPTTIIWGEKDETTPLSAGRRFASLIKGADLQVIASAGHCPFPDQPTMVINILEELK